MAAHRSGCPAPAGPVLVCLRVQKHGGVLTSFGAVLAPEAPRHKLRMCRIVGPGGGATEAFSVRPVPQGSARLRVTTALRLSDKKKKKKKKKKYFGLIHC